VPDYDYGCNAACWRSSSWRSTPHPLTDYSSINRFQIQRFEQGRWVPVGKVVPGE
jgi:hypothetical protein